MKALLCTWKRLEISGFKSFANKTVLVLPRRLARPFNITAIVGVKWREQIQYLRRHSLGDGWNQQETAARQKGEDVILTVLPPKASWAPPKWL